MPRASVTPTLPLVSPRGPNFQTTAQMRCVTPTLPLVSPRGPNFQTTAQMRRAA
jgi:hypothetical protein